MGGAQLGGIGIWSGELRYGEAGEIAEAAAELDGLGYAALWIPDVGGDVLGAVDRLLAATSSATVATGILNLWMHEAAEIAAWWKGLGDGERARVLLGIGISHAPLVEARTGQAWERPLATTRAFLDDLDGAGVPAAARCLAALGPRMLELARDRSCGAHPYLVTPDHTTIARGVLGPDALLAVEQGVVLDTDADRARQVAREALAVYAVLPNYTNNWRRLGFSDDDVDTLSDRLVDALVAWGDLDAVARRVRAHVDAGADHVCVQVLQGRHDPMPRAAWRELAGALI